jgi:hypothetical protein
VKSNHKRHLQTLYTLLISLWLEAVKTPGYLARENAWFVRELIRGATGGLRAVVGAGRMGRYSGTRARTRGGRAMPGDDAEARVRRRVRRKLNFYRDVTFFVVVVGALALIDMASGGGWWVQWVAGIWGAILALKFVGTFVGPTLWGRDVEERMVRRELERRGQGPRPNAGDG